MLRYDPDMNDITRTTDCPFCGSRLVVRVWEFTTRLSKMYAEATCEVCSYRYLQNGSARNLEEFSGLIQEELQQEYFQRHRQPSQPEEAETPTRVYSSLDRLYDDLAKAKRALISQKAELNGYLEYSSSAKEAKPDEPAPQVSLSQKLRDDIDQFYQESFTVGPTSSED